MATLGYMPDDGDGPCCKARWKRGGTSWRCSLSPHGDDAEHVATGPPEENDRDNLGKLPVYARWHTVGVESS